MKEEVNDWFKKHDDEIFKLQERWDDDEDFDPEVPDYDDQATPGGATTAGGTTRGGPTAYGSTTRGGPTPTGQTPSTTTTRGGPSSRAADIDYDPTDIAGYLKRKQEVDKKK